MGHRPAWSAPIGTGRGRNLPVLGSGFRFRRRVPATGMVAGTGKAAQALQSFWNASIDSWTSASARMASAAAERSLSMSIFP